MAGLLGEGFEDPRSAANMALAAGLLRGDFGGGLLGANAAYGGARQGAMKQRLTDMQMQNMQSEIEARKLKTVQDQRQQSMIEGLFPGLMGGPSAPGSQPGAAPGMGGAGAAPSMGAPAQPGGNNLLALSQQLGIPPEALKTDLIFNGGKGIADMLYKRGTPNMKVSNGYAYDENRVGPGYLPQLNTSQNGQTSMVQIGPDGMPVVSAPRGALPTYQAYQDAEQRSKAAYDPLTVTPPGAGSNPVMRSRLSVMQEANTPAPQPGMSGNFTGNPEQVAASIAAIRDPQERANAQAAFEAQMRSSGGRLGIPMQSKAEELKGNRLAEAEATRETENTNKGNQFKDFRDQLGVAKTLLSAGPTNSGFGAMADQAANTFGISLPGATVAQALDTTSKWLSQNVPKAPGAQSDAELKEYQGAAGLVGDKRVPVAQRQAALQTVERLIDTWEKRRGQVGATGPAGGATGDFGDGKTMPKPQVVNDLPKMAKKGAKARDTVTGDVLTFNGLSWVK